MQQNVHAAIRALGFALPEQTGVNERERPMLELELGQFRQPLRVGKIRGLTLFLMRRVNRRAATENVLRDGRDWCARAGWPRGRVRAAGGLTTSVIPSRQARNPWSLYREAKDSSLRSE